MNDIIERAEQRLHMAHRILAQLQLLERWSTFGTPILVGADLLETRWDTYSRSIACSFT